MLCARNSFKKCKLIRTFAKVALKEKHINNSIEKNGLKSKTAAKQTEEELIKPYEDIPGPKGFLGIGTFYHYLPVIGKYTWDAVHTSGAEKNSQYGDIVKERMVPGVDVIWLFDPNDIAKVLNNSGPDMYPQRKSHLGLEKYRKDRPHIYKTGGLLPTNGSEWWRLRSEFQKGLSSPNHIRQFLTDSDAITKQFVSQVQPTGTNNPNEIEDFLPELSRLNLELVCYLAFDVRMETFTEKERSPHSRSTKLIHAAEDSNSCLIPLDQGFPIWRIIETPVYRKFRLSQEYIESVAIDLVSQKISYFDDRSNSRPTEHRRSLLDDYLLNSKLDLADILGFACDLLLTGVDTTTYTTCFILYHLARNPDCQERVFQEALNVLPDYDNDALTVDKMSNELIYSRAVLKETFRINPVSVGVGRTTNTDLILSNYMVPKGTITVTQNFISCRLAKHFDHPDRFMPERWLKSDQKTTKTNTNPYLVLPFSHGMRSCIARRFAEQNMLVLMLRMIRKFEIGWQGVDYLDVNTTTTINKPDDPVKLTFKRRSY